MRLLFVIFLTLSLLAAHGQSKHITYSNDLNSYENKLNKDAFFEAKINEITLNTDSTFEFWSRPNISCFTWHQYKGTWKKVKDTILFHDNYEVIETDMRATYKKDNKPRYIINFLTDKNSELKNKAIRIQYTYDFNAHLEDIEKTFYINANNVVEIPFDNIPNINYMAAFRLEYLLNDKAKRYGYLTENKFANLRNGDLPNVIRVVLIENPKIEIVYRTIKGFIKNNVLEIVSTFKNKTALPDYNGEIIFEKSYQLNK